MSLVRRLLTSEKRALTESQLIRAALLGGTRSATGRIISEQGSLGLMAVFTAVRVLADAFAQVPLKVYRRDGDGRTEMREHPLYRILHERPNPEMTSFAWRAALMGHLATWGNAYAEIERNFLGEVIGLWPLLPDRTKPTRSAAGELVYETRVPASLGNSTKDQTVTLPARSILHIPGLGFDGLVGYSVIRTVREGIGLAMAYEEFGARFFGNDATPGFMLTTEKVIPPEKHDDLERRWLEKHQGLTNAQRLAILDNGLKPVSIGIPLEDAQFIEGRKLSRSEIIGLYRVPPHMVGDTEKSTSWGSGIAAQATGFIKFVMDPWFVNAEQTINVKLLGANAQGPLFCEFDREGFLRGDFRERLDGYQSLFNMGVISNVGIARLENLPKPPNEVWLVPSNMNPVDKVDAIADKQAAPTPVGPDATGEAAMRRTLIASQKHVLVDAVDRILRRERADVPRLIERQLKQGGDLPAILDAFYRDHRAYASKNVLPALCSLADAIRSDVERETGRTANITPFIRQYADGFAERLCSASHDELHAAIMGKPEIERILASWDRRAETLAASEVVRAGNAFARKCYEALGIVPVWSGTDCDECRDISAGGPTPEKVHHPPLHDGCDCVLVLPRRRSTHKAGNGAALLAVLTEFLTRDEEHAPPPVVNVTPQIEVRIDPSALPAPIVNIQPPAVTITPPNIDVHVAAPIVNVAPELRATLHQPETEFVKDALGNIIGVRSVE